MLQVIYGIQVPATATIKAFQVGIFWCDVKKDGCTFRDSLAITAVNLHPLLTLGMISQFAREFL
jgi:hypothetical protein